MGVHLRPQGLQPVSADVHRFVSRHGKFLTHQFNQFEIAGGKSRVRHRVVDVIEIPDGHFAAGQCARNFSAIASILEMHRTDTGVLTGCRKSDS